MRQRAKYISLILWLCGGGSLFASSEGLPDSVAVASLDEVVVVGSYADKDRRNVSKTEVERKQIEITQQTSILKAVSAYTPGFFSTERGLKGFGVATGGSGQITIRGIGSAPNTGVLVLIDGEPQMMGMMGHPLPDALDASLAENVEIVRMPSSVVYGSGAMGGVVNIISRKPTADTVVTQVNLEGGSFGSFGGQASNQLQKGRLTSSVSLFGDHTNGHRDNSNYTQYGGNAKIGVKCTERFRAEAFFALSHFDAENPGPEYAPLIDNTNSITRGSASLSLLDRFDNAFGGIRFYGTWGLHEINDGFLATDAPKDYLYESKDHLLGINIYQSAKLWKGGLVTLGIDLQTYGGKAWNEYDDSRADQMLADTTLQNIGAYIQLRQKIGKVLSLNAGLRGDCNSISGTEIVPQGGLSFSLRSGEINLSASKGFRRPTLKELFMFRPANPELESERLISYELGYRFAKRGIPLSAGVAVFFIDGDNMIQTQMVEGEDGAKRPMNANTGKVRNCGAEADLAVRFSEVWTLFANYSFTNKKYVVLASPDHKVCAGASFEKRRVSLSTDITFISGLATNLEKDKAEDYVLWNFRAEVLLCKFLFAYARCENILAQRYEIIDGYEMPKATFFGGLKFKF